MAGDQDWSVGPTTSTKDWGADDTGDWGNTEPKVVANFCEYSGNTISFTEKTLWITHLCHQQTPRPQILRVYHVAENFWGRKLSRILRFCGYTWEFSSWNLECGILWCGKPSNPGKFSPWKLYFSPRKYSTDYIKLTSTVVAARKSSCSIPYSGKLSREKTLEFLWLFMNVTLFWHIRIMVF